MSMSAFRKTAKAVRENTSEGTNERDPWQSKNFQMDVGEPPAKVCVCEPPEDTSFLTMNFHRLGGWNRTCTADLEGFNGNCNYCHYHQTARKANKDSKDAKNLWRRFRIFMEVIDFRFEHWVEETKDGRTRKVTKRCGSDELVPKWKRGRSCKWCSSKDPAVAERHFGGRKKYELTQKGFEPFKDLEADVQQKAFIVRDEDQIQFLDAYTVGFACGNCGEICVMENGDDITAMDEDALRDMDPDALEAWAEEEYECPSCGETHMPREVWVAVDDDDNEYDESEEYDGPYRLSIFMRPLKVMCSGTEKNGKTYRDYSYSADAYGVATPEEELDKAGFSEDQIAEFMTPMNLLDVFKPEGIKPDEYDNEDAYVAAVLQAQANRLDRFGEHARDYSGGEAKGERYYVNMFGEQGGEEDAKPKADRPKFRTRRGRK